jgi:hypothetical protein
MGQSGGEGKEWRARQLLARQNASMPKWLIYIFLFFVASVVPMFAECELNTILLLFVLYPGHDFLLLTFFLSRQFAAKEQSVQLWLVFKHHVDQVAAYVSTQSTAGTGHTWTALPDCRTRIFFVFWFF